MTMQLSDLIFNTFYGGMDIRREKHLGPMKVTMCPGTEGRQTHWGPKGAEEAESSRNPLIDSLCCFTQRYHGFPSLGLQAEVFTPLSN